MSKPNITRHFHLYRIESNWRRRAVLVATMPLLFVTNLGLMLLGVALFWWQNQRELFRSAAHYWRTSERIDDAEAQPPVQPIALMCRACGTDRAKAPCPTPSACVLRGEAQGQHP